MADGAIGPELTQAFAEAQRTQQLITAETMNHQNVMKRLEAMKNAFMAIKG